MELRATETWRVDWGTKMSWIDSSNLQTQTKTVAGDGKDL